MNKQKRDFVLNNNPGGLEKESTRLIGFALPVVTLFFAWCTVERMQHTFSSWNQATMLGKISDVIVTLGFVTCTILFPWGALKEISNRKKANGMGTLLAEGPPHTTNRTDRVISGSAAIDRSLSEE